MEEYPAPFKRSARMQNRYEINQLEKEESWRMFRIIGEFVEGFDTLSRITPAVTVFGSARARPGDFAYDMAEAIGGAVAKAAAGVDELAPAAVQRVRRLPARHMRKLRLPAFRHMRI